VQLSVIIPAYNEAATLEEIVRRVERVSVDKEIIVVDDCSSDGTSQITGRLAASGRIRLFRHEWNRGKGAALRTGFAQAQGDIVVVQDADLEYDPEELPRLMKPILANKADVVFGSRFAGGESHRVLYFWHFAGNRLLTLVSNMLTDLNLTDMETCYKLFRREVLREIQIEEARFGFEPEITAKVARGGWRIYETGISYSGRTYAEGKKIGWRDGARALWCIAKYNLRPASFSPPPPARVAQDAAPARSRADSRRVPETSSGG
jgi:glycosyltransferase involved in cell wall biosynthesis